AKDVLLDGGARLACGIEEVIVGIQLVVAEIFVGVTMKLARAGPENGIDVAAAVAALAGVIERPLHLKFLNDVRIGKRNISSLGDVVIGSGDAVDQVVVVILALAVDDDADIAAAELRGSVQFALRAARERQELLVVLRGQRKFTNRFGADGLA